MNLNNNNANEDKIILTKKWKIYWEKEINEMK